MNYRISKYLGVSILLIQIQADHLLAENVGLKGSPVDISTFVTMFLGLFAVIALIFFVAWLSRKLKLVQHLGSGYQIKSLASLSLSNREKVCLIEVGGTQLLIGIAPGNVRNLHVFEPSMENSKNGSTANAPETKNNQFSQLFKNALGITSTKSLHR